MRSKYVLKEVFCLWKCGIDSLYAAYTAKIQKQYTSFEILKWKQGQPSSTALEQRTNVDIGVLITDSLLKI